MKNIVIAATVMTLALSGCANTNLSKEAQAGLGVLGGAGLGAGIGGAVGGGKGAAIGAGAGALLGGLVAYALASDPYTQSVSQQGATWQEETGAKPEIVKASQVVENGQTVQKIDIQKMVVSDEQMVSKNHLSPKVKNQLITAKKESLKVGGNVEVICPASATQNIMNEINMTGVSYRQDETLSNGYVVVLSRSNEGIST